MLVFPWPVLGLSPNWYKSAPYRSRAVIDPKGVLADFGVALPEGTEVRAYDSTAELRYLVVPMRPAGTEGWSEARLATLVTRDAMIGTGLAFEPSSAGSRSPACVPPGAPWARSRRTVSRCGSMRRRAGSVAPRMRGAWAD